MVRDGSCGSNLCTRMDKPISHVLSLVSSFCMRKESDGLLALSFKVDSEIYNVNCFLKF